MKLLQRLNSVEKELEKVRGCSPLTDGFGTKRYARKSRAWDVLAKKRMDILLKIDQMTLQDVISEFDLGKNALGKITRLLFLRGKLLRLGFLESHEASDLEELTSWWERLPMDID